MKGLFANTKHDEPIKYKRIQLCEFLCVCALYFLNSPSVRQLWVRGFSQSRSYQRCVSEETRARRIDLLQSSSLGYIKSAH